ncbi:hypothetical protein, partial [Acetobacter sp. DsW_063]|uniref:hypothetical protein n=1 Tax=Acetobacter sp. DsW_063 TaxID=1514894 RepID=UPI001E38858B
YEHLHGDDKLMDPNVITAGEVASGKEDEAQDKTLSDGYVRNDDGSITALLAYPVGDGPRQLRLRRFNGRTMVEVLNAKGEGDRAEKLVVGALGLVGPKADRFIADLDAADFVRLSEAAASFLPSGRRNGRSSSPA